MGNTNDEPQANGAGASGGFTLSQEPVVALPAEPAPGAASTSPLPAFEQLGELPASYGTDALFLIARDPHWLFTYWDFDWLKVPPVGGRVPLFHLRVLKADGAEEATVEIRPEARNWYLPVGEAGAEYVAELGYFNADGAWQTCVRSRATRTPPNTPARAELPVGFATVSAALTFEQLIGQVREQRAPGESLVDAVGRLTNELRTQSGGAVIDEAVRARVIAALREETEAAAPSWSREFGETSGPSWPPQLFAAEASGPSWPPQVSARVEGGASTPLTVDVVLRAGLAPDARVTIDGRPVGLEPDGSFRLQLQMAEHDWTIPIVVRSADGRETRSGTLSFTASGSAARGAAESAQPLPQWTGFA